VIEIKGDEELHEPSEANHKKNEYAEAHFQRINEYLEQQTSALRYKFNFLTESNFNKFFQSLREGRIASFRSDLDVKLSEET
jgi:type III restriction enzyme